MLPALEWEDEALDELRAIHDYIAKDNPEAAEKLCKEIRYNVNQLPYNPRLYPRWRVPGTRKMTVRKRYIVIYAEAPEVVTILHILHGAMGFFN